MLVEELIKQQLPKGVELVDFTLDMGNDCFRDPVIEMTLRGHLNEFKDAPKKVIQSPNESKPKGLRIDDVIYNDPATIVFWNDGTKTVVKCQEDDIYSKEQGLALCITKKVLGNQGNFNNLFRKWCKE
jgi:hypothetical protein